MITYVLCVCLCTYGQVDLQRVRTHTRTVYHPLESPAHEVAAGGWVILPN